MKMFLIVLGSALFAGLTSPVRAQENLLENPTLEVDVDSRSIPGWLIAPRDTRFENTTDTMPADASRSLMITVGPADTMHGQLTQKLKVSAGDGVPYTISGWLMSDVQDAAYLQVKFYRGGRELKRVNLGSSGSDWTQISESVPVDEADAIEVLCRWHQRATDEGKRVFFANIAVTRSE